MLRDDKSQALIHEIIANFDGSSISVSIDEPATVPRTAEGVPATIHGRDGRGHPVILYPVHGALGFAVLGRIDAAASRASAPVVVVAAVVGRELRTALVERGLSYLDLAGNCHLELNRGNLTVHVEGRRRPPVPVGKGSLRAAGYQVLFALLADESLLGHTVRDIATAANASRHAAHSLIERLRDEGILHRAGRSLHVYAPDGRDKCIDRFTSGWADVLRGRLLAGRYRLREREPLAVVAAVERAFRAAQVPFGFGGAHGSTRWLRHLQSDETIVHAGAWSPDLARTLGAVPDRQGPLFVFRTMTALDLAPEVTETAHPLLIHAELARSPDPRARETATLLLESFVSERR